MAATEQATEPAAAVRLDTGTHGAHGALPAGRPRSQLTMQSGGWAAWGAWAALQPYGALSGVLLAGSAAAVELPPDRAEALYHVYDGGGTKATGPALLVRKSLLDNVALSGTYYVDSVSNASIDVLTTASPYRERRTEYGAAVDVAYRDALVSLGTTRSREPDYAADNINLDVAQEVLGGLTTVSVGTSRGYDKVGRRYESGFFDRATHWRYRLGVSQIVSPRWIVSLNGEALNDDGYLGSPYRSARVFGAAVPERNPRTRSARAVTLRAVGNLQGRDALYGAYRYYTDNWAIRGHTFDLGYRRYVAERWLGEGFVRYYRQRGALFYSDNATAESLYISRNRQLSSFNSASIGAKVAWTVWQAPAQTDVKLNAAYERVRYRFDDFTDLRNGQRYAHGANVLQFFVSANF